DSLRSPLPYGNALLASQGRPPRSAARSSHQQRDAEEQESAGARVAFRRRAGAPAATRRRLTAAGRAGATAEAGPATARSTAGSAVAGAPCAAGRVGVAGRVGAARVGGEVGAACRPRVREVRLAGEGDAEARSLARDLARVEPLCLGVRRLSAAGDLPPVIG